MSDPDPMQTNASGSTHPQPPSTRNNLAISIGRKIRVARNAKKLSLDAAASQAKLAPERLRRLEAGIERVQPLELYDLSQVLDKSISYFFKGGRRITART